MTWDRKCCVCGRPITMCNGFANAGDFLRLLAGEQIIVRETCGWCMELQELIRNPQLMLLQNNPPHPDSMR